LTVKAKTRLIGCNRAELTTLVEREGEAPFRVQQLLEGIYRQRVDGLEKISTLPQQFRASLAAQAVCMGLPTIKKGFTSRDGTVRYLFSFDDGQSVESVWMPEGDDGETGDGSEAGDLLITDLAPAKHVRRRDRATICVSSQAGCAVDCRFCLTALLGLKRNLTAGEIVGQVLCILNEQKVSPPDDRINLVFMGMGEPFLNYDNFIKAVRLLVEEVGIAESRMTVSTAGIVPRIRDFGDEAIRPKLAISLNASNDELRTRLMPLNRKWNLEALISAARDFPLRNRERITFEYVLLNGVNDSPQNAREVVELLRGMRAKVNLIALNPGPGVEFRTPVAERVAAFQQIITRAGIPAFVRQPRGRDIYAACGQLKQTVELATAPPV
jgi:23S rRNA (adenine2503-C2)-methyltransferase